MGTDSYPTLSGHIQYYIGKSDYPGIRADLRADFKIYMDGLSIRKLLPF